MDVEESVKDLKKDRHLKCKEREAALTRAHMVWGAIPYRSRFFPGRKYECPGLHSLCFGTWYTALSPETRKPYFPAGHWRIHTAAVSTKSFVKFTVLPWPSSSSDLSPIEPVRDIMGTTLGRLPVPRMDQKHLRDETQIAWDTIPKENIDYLIRSMPRIVKKCIDFRRAPIH